MKGKKRQGERQSEGESAREEEAEEEKPPEEKRKCTSEDRTMSETEEKSEDSAECEESAEETGQLETGEIGEEDRETLKGDTIGETLYSGKWILNILLSVSKFQEDGWNNDLENELCTLWDITAEKEVARFLVENDFLNIAEFILKSVEEPRLTEILVGIIGNLSCDPDILESLSTRDELVKMILDLLQSDDTPTLVQVIRVLQSTLWNIRNEPDSRWKRNLKGSAVLGEALPFILRSSTNKDLLIATMNFLRSTSEIPESKTKNLLEVLFEGPSLLPALTESLEEVLSQEESCVEIVDFLEDSLELLSGLTRRKDVDKATIEKSIAIIRRILPEFTDPWSLFPLDVTKASCIHCCVEIALRFRGQSAGNEEADRAVLRIIFRIKKATEEGQDDPEETMKELSKYLESYWAEISRTATDEEISKILKPLEKEVLEHSFLKSKLREEKFQNVMKLLQQQSAE